MERLAVLSIALASIAPALANADTVTTRDRVTNGVKVRAGPSGDATVKGVMKPGESADMVASIPRWYEIRLPNNLEGFVSKSFTQRVPGGATAPLTPRSTGELRIHFLPVGAGTCTIVECPGSAAPPLIIDCGSRGREPEDLDETAVRSRFSQVLGGRSVNLVLSHGDQDHYNLVPTALEGVEILHIWQGGQPDDYGVELRDFLADRAAGGTVLHQDLGPHFDNDEEPLAALNCGGAAVFVLTVNTGASTNARSLVLSVDYGDFVAVFTGDAIGTTENRAMANYSNALKASVLAGSHHGAATQGSNGLSSTSDWPIVTEPEVVVYSAGVKFGHPRCKATGQYHTVLAQVAIHPMQCGVSNTEFRSFHTSRAEYSTEVSGTVVITTNGESPMTLWCDRSVGCNATIAF